MSRPEIGDAPTTRRNAASEQRPEFQTSNAPAIRVPRSYFSAGASRSITLSRVENTGAGWCCPWIEGVLAARMIVQLTSRRGRIFPSQGFRDEQREPPCCTTADRVA